MKSNILLALTIFCITGTVTPMAVAQSPVQPLITRQAPIPPEKSPPGDIPDNQIFVTFKSLMGFSIKVPEGWARAEAPGLVHFNDKYNALQVTVKPRATAPDISGLKASELADLQKMPNAIRINLINPQTLPAGQAWVVHYGSNSDVNLVTNKAIRLDNANYYFWKSGKLATVTVSAPAGADNADQWQLMSRSFTWQ